MGRLGRRERGVLCVLDGSRLLAYGEVMPLSVAHYRQLRAGRVIEEWVPAYWIRSGRAGHACWYVGSLVVDRRVRLARPEVAHALSRRLQRAIWRHIGRHGRVPARVLGIAATRAGEVKFRQSGFAQCAPAADAIDRRPRFEVTLDRKSLRIIVGAAAGRAGGAPPLRSPGDRTRGG